MAAAHYASRDVVGDLGGMPVTIPSHFADLVEYNGDPGWSGKRAGSHPERTHASKLASFGFYARFPDMAGLSSEALRNHKQSQSIYKTMWLSVGLSAGERYYGAGILERLTNAMGKSGGIVKFEQYEKLPGEQHGLTVYAAAGIDPKTARPYREDRYASDIFVHRNEAGRVDTYIRCSNDAHVARCKQNFSLEPAVQANIFVSYRRDLLPEWRQMQASVTQLILSFKAPTATGNP